MLTNSNYYQDKSYFSCSQLKSFMDCEARTMAEIKGEWENKPTTAMLVGSFVDSYFEGKEAFEQFVSEHPEIFKKDGTPKADYVKALDIINRIEQDELFTEYMSGDKQVILTGEIDGYPFKGKMDSYHPGRMIVDLKCMRSLDRIMGRSLVEHWDYNLQGAIYRALEGNNLPFYLAIATKEDPVDLEIVELDPMDMDESLNNARKLLPRFDAIKKGEIQPERCGKCAYCRATKKLTKPIPADELGLSNKDLKILKGEYQ